MTDKPPTLFEVLNEIILDWRRKGLDYDEMVDRLFDPQEMEANAAYYGRKPALWEAYALGWAGHDWLWRVYRNDGDWDEGAAAAKRYLDAYEALTDEPKEPK